jgi:hypothetical protein
LPRNGVHILSLGLWPVQARRNHPHLLRARGYILRKRFTWGRFIFASHLTLTLADLVVAALYILVYKTLYMGQLSGLGRGSLALLVVGLTLW